MYVPKDHHVNYHNHRGVIYWRKKEVPEREIGTSGEDKTRVGILNETGCSVIGRTTFTCDLFTNV